MDFTGEFDVIFSNAALHWVKDHESLLRNSLAALKKNGLIRWNFGGDGNCANFINTVRTVMHEDDYQGYFVDFDWPWFMPTQDEYATILANAGFSKVRLELENADRYFADRDEMIKWIDQPSLVPFMEHLPPQLRAGFRTAVIELMVQAAEQPDGRCFETFRRIDVKGCK
ncbi:MAG: methyltransferase domain-containing protein [Firmicutes bacterium]|nr:methyltransferase domain-containing protein [Bacillota bacterium]